MGLKEEPILGCQANVWQPVRLRRHWSPSSENIHRSARIVHRHNQNQSGPGALQQISYHLYRWYETGTSRYSKPDPEYLEQVLFFSMPVASNYIYAHDRPTLLVDPFGLRTFEPVLHPSCNRKLSESEQADLKRAATAAAATAADAPPCSAKGGKRKVKIICGDCVIKRGPYKGGANCGQGGGWRSRICINLPFHNEGRCGTGSSCLEATIFHELIHRCGGDQEVAFACQKRFYESECKRNDYPCTIDSCS